jgi:hypothetical protein
VKRLLLWKKIPSLQDSRSNFPIKVNCYRSSSFPKCFQSRLPLTH